MEENDGFRKQRGDKEEKKDRNQNKELGFAHKKAYSTDKKLMSNGVISYVASF
jgi:hypothetical protein